MEGIYEPRGVGRIWEFDNRQVLLKGWPQLSLAVSGPSEVSDKDNEKWLSSA